MMFPILPGSTPIGVDTETAAGAQGVLVPATESPPLPLIVGGSLKMDGTDSKAVATAKRTARRLARVARRAAVVSKPGGGAAAKAKVKAKNYERERVDREKVSTSTTNPRRSASGAAREKKNVAEREPEVAFFPQAGWGPP